MCGIFGLIFHAPVAPENHTQIVDLFETLALVNLDRGRDATGVAAVQYDGSYSMHKDTRPSTVILSNAEWQQVLSGINSKTSMLIGHTRAGTHGPNTPENAHPFVFPTKNDEPLVGCHNGVIWDHASLNPSTEKFANDSANMYAGMAAADSIIDFLPKISGSFALAFAIGGRPYLLRHSNPCHVAKIPSLNATVFSSIALGIAWGTAIANLEHTTVTELKENVLYSYQPFGEEVTEQEFKSYPSYGPGAWGSMDSWEGYHYGSYSSAYRNAVASRTNAPAASAESSAPIKYKDMMLIDGPGTIKCSYCSTVKHEPRVYSKGGRCVCGDCVWAFFSLEVAELNSLRKTPTNAIHCICCGERTFVYYTVGVGKYEMCETCYKSGKADSFKAGSPVFHVVSAPTASEGACP